MRRTIVGRQLFFPQRIVHWRQRAGAPAQRPWHHELCPAIRERAFPARPVPGPFPVPSRELSSPESADVVHREEISDAGCFWKPTHCANVGLLRLVRWRNHSNGLRFPQRHDAFFAPGCQQHSIGREGNRGDVILAGFHLAMIRPWRLELHDPLAVPERKESHVPRRWLSPREALLGRSSPRSEQLGPFSSSDRLSDQSASALTPMILHSR